VPPEPTPAEIRAAISDPVKWAQIRTVFAIRFSQQPPTTPEKASICAATADPVAWECVRTMIAANHAPQQPAVISQAAPSTPPQSATTAATDAPREPALVPQPGTVDHAPQQRAAVPQPSQNATRQSVEIAGAAAPANRSPQPAEAPILLSRPHAPQPEPLIAAAPKPSGTTSADTVKPSAQRTHSPPSRDEPAPTHRLRQRRNPVRKPVAQRLTVRAPPQPKADHNLIGCPILRLLTAERLEPVLFGGRRLPIGVG
jgi:hypothetical protein